MTPEKLKKIPAWVTAVCLLVLLVGIHGHEAWTPDEPREAEIARALAEGDSWLIPRLSGRPFVEKPPFYYWVSALSIAAAGRLIGPTAAARGVSAISSALTLLLVWAAARRHLGKARALEPVLALCTMYGFVLYAHWINIDPLLMFLSTAAVLFFFTGVERGSPPLLLGGYLAAGLAFLSKGLVAWLLIALPWLLIAWLRRDGLRRRAAWHAAGILLLLLPPVAWMIAFRIQGSPELWREWFVINHLGRFTGQAAYLGHIKGPFFYFRTLPVLVAPWTPLLLDWLFRRGWRRFRQEPPESRRLLWCLTAWALGGFVLLTLSSTKREIYLLPLLPPLGILAGLAAPLCSAWVRIFYRWFGVVLFLPLPVFSALSLAWSGEKVVVRWGLNLPVLVCALLAAFALFKLKNHCFPRLAALSGLFYLAFFFSVFPVLDQVWSYEPVARAIAGAIPAGRESRVCGWHAGEVERAIFPYYCGFPLPDVRDRDRLVRILAGTDPQFDLVIVSRLEEHFLPADDPPLPPWEVLFRHRKGSGRYFYLISGRSAPPP